MRPSFASSNVLALSFLSLLLQIQPCSAGPFVGFIGLISLTLSGGIAGIVYNNVPHKTQYYPPKRTVGPESSVETAPSQTLTEGGSSTLDDAVYHPGLDQRDVVVPHAPPGVPQFVLDECVKELSTTVVKVTGPVLNNGIFLENVPPTCMTLATVLIGDPVLGPFPTPMGSASLQYNNLTPDQYNQFKQIFDKAKKA